MPHTRQSYFGHRPTHSTVHIRDPIAPQRATAPPGRAAAPHTVLAATARVVVRSSTCRTWRDGTRVQSDLVPIINKNADRVSATHTIPRYRSTMTQNIRHNSYRVSVHNNHNGWCLAPRFILCVGPGRGAGRFTIAFPAASPPSARARAPSCLGRGGLGARGCRGRGAPAKGRLQRYRNYLSALVSDAPGARARVRSVMSSLTSDE